MAALPLEILIVEDHAVLRGAMRELLQAYYAGCVVHEAGSCAEALALASEHRPRLVLLDVMLPDGDGLDAVARLRALHPQAALLVVSQLGGADIAARAQAAGATAFLSKERLADKLLPAIRTALDGDGARHA